MPVLQEKDRVTLQHTAGASADILLYGATVISWKSSSNVDKGPEERLFVSSKAAIDGSKPVRGGIPVVFPCFGAPTHPDHSKLSQHGFARSEVWVLDSVVMDNEAGVSVKLVLEPTPRITSVFPKAFRLAYVVTLAEHQLSTDLHVENTSGTDVLEFQALLHNYIRTPSSDVRISSLKGIKYYDKTEKTDELRSTPKAETRTFVDVQSFTDFVYEDAPGKYEITWPTGAISLRAVHFKDVVVWNPQEEGRKIADMEEGGWEKYVCVEPGFVRGFVKLEPGKKWIGQQVLSTILDGKPFKWLKRFYIHCQTLKRSPAREV
ncbi:galactose mutarotase-like protein [Cyathus striatus]|nr:galactose mutarotase-like protein [Cyathus striatus]